MSHFTSLHIRANSNFLAKYLIKNLLNLQFTNYFFFITIICVVIVNVINEINFISKIKINKIKKLAFYSGLPIFFFYNSKFLISGHVLIAKIKIKIFQLLQLFKYFHSNYKKKIRVLSAYLSFNCLLMEGNYMGRSSRTYQN
jgi:hypothetical protein